MNLQNPSLCTRKGFVIRHRDSVILVRPRKRKRRMKTRCVGRPSFERNKNYNIQWGGFMKGLEVFESYYCSDCGYDACYSLDWLLGNTADSSR